MFIIDVYGWVAKNAISHTDVHLLLQPFDAILFEAAGFKPFPIKIGMITYFTCSF